MPAGVITGLLGKAAKELGKYGYKKLTEETSVSKAIAATQAAFPNLEAGRALAVWCGSDDFERLVESHKAGERNLTDDAVVRSFVEVTDFYMEDVVETDSVARQVLTTFFEKLEAEIYNDLGGVSVLANRQEAIHAEQIATLDQILDEVQDRRRASGAGEANGPVRLHTFLPPATFFGPYMGPNLLFHHRLPQVGRRARLNDLLSFVGGGSKIALLPGRGGSGKSKLLHTLCRRLARRHPNLSVRLVAENLPVTEAALKELPGDSCLIIVDDAHRTTGVEVLLAAARQNPKLKLLLVTRPHATDYLAAQARSAGFDHNHIVINKPLTDLNYAREHRRLARLVLGRDWSHYADRLASVTRDSPLLTVLGGELLRTEKVAPSFLDRHDTFRREVLSRFRDIQFGHIISQLDPRFTAQQCADVLPLVAALTPFDLENTALIQAVAYLSGANEVKLKLLLGALVKAGALVRGGRLVRIVPDVLSDFILHEACFTPDGVPTGWATRVYMAVADIRPDAVLRNLAELDWRVRTAPSGGDQSIAAPVNVETGLLDNVWLDIEDRFRSGSLSERKAWLVRLERIAYMQPHRLWTLVEIARDEPVPEDPDEVEAHLKPWVRPTTQSEVIAALVPVLRGVARDDRFTARCADLLWESGRELAGKPGVSPTAVETLRQLASYENGKPFVFNHIILECCREWMNDPNIHNYRHSILEVVSPMLARSARWIETEGRWLSYGTFIVPPEPLRELRRGAVELAKRCALSGVRRVVLGAIHTLRDPIGEEGLWQLREKEPDEWQAWEEEQLAALEIVARVAESNDDPFVRLRIWEELHWQAQRGPRPAVQSRAREILEAVPHSFESRFILLMTGKHGDVRYRRAWDIPEEDDEDWLGADAATRLLIDEKRFRWNEEFARRVTSEWVEHYPDPREGFDALGAWIERIETSDWWKDFWTRSNPFLLRLATDFPSYARAFCEVALEKPEARATGKCNDLLCELRRQDAAGTLKLVQRFLARDHPNLWLCVATSYSWRCWSPDPLPEEWQIVRDLLAFPHPRVRRSAAEVVSNFAGADRQRAIDIVLETDVGEDHELADKLYDIFEERRGFDFESLTPDELKRLLGKLKTVESVSSHSLGRFMLRAALRDPIAVTQLLLDRVGHKAKLDQKRWETPDDDGRLQAKRAVDVFGGLPSAGFHDERFKEVASHPEYPDALRLIRDAALSEEYGPALLLEDTLAELFRDFSINYGSESLEVLNEWINSDDCARVRAAMRLLDGTYLGFYVANTHFVSNYLRRARECGRTVFEEVERDMLHCAEFGPRRAIASHRGERSNALFRLASQALDDVKDDPLTSRFFQKLRERGQEMIRSEMQQAAEEEIFYRFM